MSQRSAVALEYEQVGVELIRSDTAHNSVLRPSSRPNSLLSNTFRSLITVRNGQSAAMYDDRALGGHDDFLDPRELFWSNLKPATYSFVYRYSSSEANIAL